MQYDFDTVIDRSGTFSLKWENGRDELPMWVADMDFRTAPEITAAIAERAAHGIFGYTDLPAEWYSAYTGWWGRRHHWQFSEKELIFSTGVIPTISACVRKLTTPAENVLIMPPVYNVFYNCIRNNGRNVQSCPLRIQDGQYDIDWALLAHCLADPQTTLMLLCNPHNPVGKIWDRETLARIGSLAKENGVTVLSDEIHCDLTDPGCGYVPFASVSADCAANSVVCISPTKTFNLAGLQTSAVVVQNPFLRHRVWRELNTDECGEPNAFAVQAAVAALTQGEPWLEALRAYLYRSKQTVREFLASELPMIRLTPSEATYLLWLDCSAVTEHSDQLAAEIRRRSGLRLSPGTQYGCGDRYLRMNIACPQTLLRDGLSRFASAIREIRQTP